MKKKYSTPNLIKAVSLSAAMATLLSSVSPVFAANFAFVGGNNNSTSGMGVSYIHGSHGSVVLSGDDDFCGADSVVGRGGKQQETIGDKQRITAEEQYDRFVGEKQFNSRAPYGTTTQQVTWQSAGVLTNNATYMGKNTYGVDNAMPEAFGVYSFATGCGSAATGNYSTVFGAGATAKAGGAQAFGVSALAGGIASVAMGVGSEAAGKSAVAIGGLATASGINSIALGTKVKAEQNYTIAIGTDAQALGSGSIAIGGRRSDRTEENNPNRKLEAKGENSIAIGTFAYAETDDSVAIGVNAQVFSKDGVAVGGGSISDRDKGIAGYDPRLNGGSKETDIAWKSTTGAFSVGEVGRRANGTTGTLTRQITGVAAGSEDTDAVNVAQLKAMRDVIAGGGAWKLSANDIDPTDVNSGNTVDFSVKNSEEGKDNLTIARETTEENNKHKIQFTLADNLKLTSVTTGKSTMSDDGFGFINNGPSMTINGIYAGNKVISNVADGEEDNDAVNYKQLKEVREAATTHWQLSVNGGNGVSIGQNDTVNLQSAGKGDNGNIKIVGDDKRNVTFDLADNINVTSVTAGDSVMDAAGFRFNGGDGPSITVNGIHAGNKTIKGVTEGEQDTDAVNLGQLKKYVEKNGGSWKLSVDGNNATDVKAGGTVDLVAAEGNGGHKNITLKKDNNKVTFSLNDTLKLTSVTTGNSIVNNDGFSFIDGNGPKITLGGIDAGNKKITKVEKGTEDTDAVNYKQLQDVKQLAENGWKLSVEDEEATDVKAGSTVNLVAGDNANGSNKNIKIKKDNDNKVTFSLNDDLKLTSVTTGNSKISSEGFEFIDGKGPKITLNGINAGSKKITNVLEGTDDTDAVNYKQLKDMKDLIVGDSLVKWDEDEKVIYIGAEKDGTELDITNKDGDFRVITGVAAGEYDDDAVNFAQLKEVKQLAENGWKLSVDGKDATNVKAGSTVDLIAGATKSGGKNIQIEKGKNNEVIFSLKDHIALSSVMTGNSIMSNDGFAFIDGGPSITSRGIDAGNKKITKVAAGEQDTDAVNYKQLKEIKGQIAEDSLVKWDEGEKLITIGKEKGGMKINIAGTEGERTIIGVKDADLGKDSKEAVNGSQINAISGDIAKYFGGDAAFEGGKFVGPRYNLSRVGADGKVEQKTFENVGKALEGLDVNVKNVNNHIKYVDNKFDKKFDEFSQDALLWSEEERAFVALHGPKGEKTNSKITFLKNGDISEESTDAINGSQLFKIAQNTSKYFGGSTDVLESIEPTFFIQGETYRNVTDAFTGVNVSITNIDNKIIDLKENSLVKWDEGQQLITIGKDKAGTEINIAGYGKAPRKISGVKAAEKGDEAVNKDQLDKSIDKISKDIETASAAAVLYDKNGNGSVNYESVTLGGDKNNGPVALHNVKNGSISEDSHDAINGSQINKISADIAKFFGGGAKFVNGAFEGLKYTLSAIVDGQVGKANFYDVGSALTGLDKNVQDVNQRLTNVSNKFDQKIEGISKDALLWDDSEEAFVARHEKDGKKTNSKLKYLVDGDISKDSMDAINGSQLYSMSNQLANYFGGGAKYENGKWTEPTFKIVQVNENGETVEKEHHNVADAFGDVNKNMSNINNRIDDVINKVDSDALKWNDKEKAYDATHDGKPSKIINVADGKIAEGSKDAVNGGQLWKTNERVSNVENRVSGVEKDVKHLNNRVDNISNTIADIGDIVTNIDVKVDNIDNKVNDIAEDAVRYDRDENGKKTNKITLKGGDPSEPVMIDNVADGKIETGSKEAVNGGQLHDYTKEQMKIVLDESKHYTDQKINNIRIDAIDEAVDKSKQYTDMKFNALNYSIEGVRKEARQAAAIGLAVSNLRYNDTPGKLSVGFGTGLWRSQSAFAFGAGYTSENGNIRSNVSVTTSGGHWGVGAGFNMTLN
ncbi:Vomp family autotransporter [Bartonella raoultii]|uniref:Vomp family autotransporter n=1 Tax=Bartonella raoultii TaxID=1457020 RepID=UPI001ABB4895|nr:Vomp family autotransporter [Bartonella raoultii]